MKIAVIGTGIAGNSAAYALADRHELTVYEKDLRAGGHSHTVEVNYDGVRIPVDTGFIVFNELNYPELTALFAHLGVASQPSDMGFSFSLDRGRLEWAGRGRTVMQTCDGLFAQRRNVASPGFLRMLSEILRFNRQSRADLAGSRLDGITLGTYLARHKFSTRLVAHYLAPMAAAIWSTPPGQMLGFPAENFISFFDNHRLLHGDSERPVWRTVAGGSQRYVEKLTRRFRKNLRLGCAVTGVERRPDGVWVTDSSGHRERYDQAVLACHSDEALGMLTDASAHERAVLGAIAYRPNIAYLHRDPALMPMRRRAWAAWNFLSWDAQADQDAAITYWMNELQGIDRRYPLFVSLNPPFAPTPELTFSRHEYSHPQFNAAAFAAQKRLEDVQGVNRTWFCGAWTGYGFHEDGLRSGLKVAEALGAAMPWRAPSPLLAEAAE